MVNFIVSIIFIILLAIFTFGATGMWIAGQKNQSVIKGLILGLTLNIIGLIIIGSCRSTDKELLGEALSRQLISKKEYDEIIELKIK